MEISNTKYYITRSTIDITIQGVKQILTDNSNPEKCLYAIRFVKDSIETFNQEFIKQVNNYLMEYILKIASYKINEKDDLKGSTYFPNPKNLNEIQRYGSSLVRLCLDCVRVWGMWFPEFRIYSQRLEDLKGYMPQICYFKEPLIQEHLYKPQSQNITPGGDNDDIEVQIKGFKNTLFNILNENQQYNEETQSILQSINLQIEDLFLQDLSNAFVDDFILQYQELIENKISYTQFKFHFFHQYFDKKGSSIQHESNNNIKSEQPQKNGLSSQIQQEKQQQYKSQQQQQKQQQQQQQSQLFYSQVPVNDAQYQQSILQQQEDEQQHIQEKQRLLLSNQELQSQISDYLIKIKQLEVQKSNLEQQLEKQQQQYYQQQQQQLQEQQQLEIHSKNQDFEQENILLREEIQQLKQLYSNQQLLNTSQQMNQQDYNQIEQLENLKIENVMLQEQLKLFQQKQVQSVQNVDHQQLINKFNQLDTAYFMVLEENKRLKTQIQTQQNQNLSTNQDILTERVQQEALIHQDISLLNFNETDLWSDNELQFIETPKSEVEDISDLIFPYKSPQDYYRNCSQHQYKGEQVVRLCNPIYLSTENANHYKLSCLKEKSLLAMINQLEIRQRSQLIQSKFQSELFVSTTISIKNTDLQQYQIQLKTDSVNSFSGQELKNIILKSQESVLYEFIRRVNTNLYEPELINLMINLKAHKLYLPSIFFYCVQFKSVDQKLFKQQIKKMKCFKTQIGKLKQHQQIKLLASKGSLLNFQRNEDIQLRLCDSKIGFECFDMKNKEILKLVLILRPTEEFVFQGYGNDQEEVEQFLNELYFYYS